MTAIPKNITGTASEFRGFPTSYIWFAIVMALTALFLFLLALGSGAIIYRAIWLIFLVIQLVFVWVFGRSPKKWEKSKLMIKYLIRAFRGRTLIAKYAVPAALLERYVPIKAFHNGIIEFVGNKYGILMRIEPSRISDDELDSHIAKGRSLVDSLHGSLMLKFYAVSVNSNDAAFQRNVIDIINKEDRTQNQKQHLYSIYHHLQDSTQTVIQWRFYVFVGIGEYQNLNEAKIAVQQYIPGIESKLQKSGVRVVQITDENTLALAYRQCLNANGGII